MLRIIYTEGAVMAELESKSTLAEQITGQFTGHCPAPINSNERVQLAHGGGGKLTQQLIEGMFQPHFANKALDQQGDGAVLDIGGQKLVFSTDSYVINPLFFPGGDIGSL